MRKKEIIGNRARDPGSMCSWSIQKLANETNTYCGLLTFLPGCKEVWATCNGKPVCMAGVGYKWLKYLPLDEYWCLSVLYNPENEIVEWYFDISKKNFIDENGTPCTDDLFLDLVILPDGQMIVLDADELQEALERKEITTDDYNHAYKVLEQIKDSQYSNVSFLRELSDRIRNYLCESNSTSLLENQ